uniref:Centrosomal protein 85, like n=1 Tax=Myripristis murdjan TaxID=586833 RepID=A0A667ZKG4_9TELE
MYQQAPTPFWLKPLRMETSWRSSNTSSPGWVPGYDPAWQGNPSGPGNSSRGRRHSIASDSGDTGIGTSCSDSVEDSSGELFNFCQLGGSLPTAHVMPSPSSSGSVKLSMPPSPSSTSPWSSSCQLLMPATSPLSAPGCLDMKDSWPIRRWSSLTRLSAGAEKSSARESGYRCNPDSHGSLDRGLLYGYRQDPLGSTVDPYLPSSSSSSVSQGLLLRSPGANPCYRYNLSAKSAGIDSSRSSAMSSPMKPSSLDLNYSALPESRLSSGVGAGSGLGLHSQRGLTLGHQAGGGSPIQPAVRTQMWLSEQMEYRPGLELGGGLGRTSGTEMLSGTSLPVNTLVKIKEGLLRQRELEIDRQKQQILQLHARIRENELRAQQVLQSQKGHCDDPYILKTKPSDRLCCDNEELGRKLAAAELEVLHLNDFLKQNTQKYTEDIRKLEEKMKTRDRYISSLKKKCQRESEQNREKQQRIETLEKYLADLPTLDEVQAQAQQLEEVQQKSKNLEETVSRLEKSLEESCALMKEKEDLIETQAKKEKELVATVNSLQQKVQQCLEDGVRLPMLDLKQLEVENTQLLEQQDHSSKVLSYINTYQQVDKEVLGCPVSHVELPEAGCLLKEMSLCLLDLQALCSILAQRAQGKEPNLALLLGIKCIHCKALNTGNIGKAKLLEVGQLRRDIDELRKNISDRYAQDMGDNCVTQ